MTRLFQPVRQWPVVSFAVLVCAMAAMLVVLPVGSGAVADAGLGGVPNADQVQSRCASLNISTHVVHVGDKITATAGPAHPEACHGSATWTWPGFSGLTVVSGCRPNGTSCELKATTATPSVDQVSGGGDVTYPTGPSSYATACLAGNSGFGGWASCEYYAVVGKDDAVIEGTITDKDGNGARGVAVRAISPGASYRGQTGMDGYFAIEVKPGSYRVVPQSGAAGKRETSFRPESANARVAAGDTAHANFVLEGGIQVKLTLSSASVAATGYAILKGSIDTTLYGAPDPGVTVALWPKANQDPDAAVSDGALATICGSSGSRIWPTGTLSAPDGSPVNITTDPNGHYDFTVAVGSVPGPFKLTAWARDAAGQLIAVDTVDTSDDVTVSFTGKPAAAAKGTLRGLFGDTSLLQSYVKPKLTFSANPVTLAGQLASGEASGSGSATSTGFPVLGGLAFAPASGSSSGSALLIYPAADPPAINSEGLLSGSPEALVLAQANWVGPLENKVTYPELSDALQAGFVKTAPTFAEWTSGFDGLAQWKLTRQTLSISGQAFQYYGWPYPSTSVGTCS